MRALRGVPTEPVQFCGVNLPECLHGTASLEQCHGTALCPVAGRRLAGALNGHVVQRLPHLEKVRMIDQDGRGEVEDRHKVIQRYHRCFRQNLHEIHQVPHAGVQIAQLCV